MPTLGLWFGSFAAEGRESVAPFVNAAVSLGQVSPGFFETLGVDVVAGRDFTAADVDDEDLV